MNRLLLLVTLSVLRQLAFAFPVFDPCKFPLHSAESYNWLTDTIAPSIICPPAQTMELSYGNCDTIVSYVVTAEDNQPGFQLIQTAGVASGISVPPGIFINQFLVTDQVGNTASCSFTINVTGAPPQCKSEVTVYLNANCSAAPPASYYLADSNLCAQQYEILANKGINASFEQAVFDENDAGKNYTGLIQTPGNPAYSCSTNIHVRDTIPPALICPPPQFVSITKYNPTFGYYENNHLLYLSDQCSAVDNSNVYFEKIQTHQLSCDSLYRYREDHIWHAKDKSNNTATCVQHIYFKNESIDEVYFPKDTVVNCNSGYVKYNYSYNTDGPYLLANGKKLTFFGYTNDFTSYFKDSTIYNCADTRVIYRLWTVHQECPTLNKTSIQKITVIDTLAPKINCPNTITIALQSADCQKTINLPFLNADFNCSDYAPFSAVARWEDSNGAHVLGGYLGSSTDPAYPYTIKFFAPVELEIGKTQFKYSVASKCGDTSTCSFALQLLDTVAPTAHCAAMQSVNVLGQLSASQLDNSSLDNCAAVYLKVAKETNLSCSVVNTWDDKLRFCCEEVGDTLSLRLRVYDAEPPVGAVSDSLLQGHFSECIARVIVTDSTGFFCIPPPDVHTTCITQAPGLNFGFPFFSCETVTVDTTIDYSGFDSICHKGLVKKTFVGSSANGIQISCTQNIEFDDKQDYYIKFPGDVVPLHISQLHNNFGQPQIYGSDCFNLQIDYSDSIRRIAPDACYYIFRTWKITNPCFYDPNKPLIKIPRFYPPVRDTFVNMKGPVISAAGATDIWAPTLAKLDQEDWIPTNYSAFWSNTANGYEYTQLIRTIDTEDPVLYNVSDTLYQVYLDETSNNQQLWNAPYWYSPVQGADLFEFPVDLKLSAQDEFAQFDSINYALYLDLDNDSIPETIYDNSYPPGLPYLYFNNAPPANYYSGWGQFREFDFRQVPENQKYRFGLQTSRNGTQLQARVIWHTQDNPGIAVTPEFPYGHHKIVWTVMDQCYNQTTVDYNFTIKEGNTLHIICDTAATINLDINHAGIGFARQFLIGVLDNDSPADSLQFSVVKHGQSTGFPLNPDGSLKSEILYNCSEIGDQVAIVWARDPENHQDSCLIHIKVTDSDLNCPEAVIDTFQVLGRIQTEEQKGLAQEP